MQAGTPIRISLYGVHNKTNSDEPQVEAEVVLVEKPAQYGIVSHWCDHLEGERSAKVILRLKKASGETVLMDIFDGYHQRGDNGKYIHFEDIRAGEAIIDQAEAGDTLQVCTICGKNGAYKEFEDVEGEIDYEAEVRLFMFEMQITATIDNMTQPPATNIIFKMSEKENTHFQAMWPHLRENLKRMSRIQDNSVTENLKELWNQPAE